LRSEADTSQLNLPHETKKIIEWKYENKKKRICSEVTVTVVSVKSTPKKNKKGYTSFKTISFINAAHIVCGAGFM